MLHSYGNQTSFFESRQKALVEGILDAIRRQPSDMLAFDDVRSSLNIRGQLALGYQVVSLKQIIGSEGRYSDFDRRFLPRSPILRERWQRVERAMREARTLPPVELSKIGDIYFVRDGNHRVSVARWLGHTEIDAYVTELLVDVPLTAELSIHTLLFKQEYSDFLEWTGLHDLRPEERIEFSELGGYLDIVRHINAHRYTLSQRHGRPIERDEAVASWYDCVYMPIVRVIREQGVLRRGDSRSEADLYRWIMEHRDALGQQLGEALEPSEASAAYTQAFARRRWTDTFTSALWSALRQSNGT